MEVTCIVNTQQTKTPIIWEASEVVDNLVIPVVAKRGRKPAAQNPTQNPPVSPRFIFEYHSDHLKLENGQKITVLLTQEKRQDLLDNPSCAYAMNGTEVDSGPPSSMLCVSFGGLMGRFALTSRSPTNTKLWYMYVSL